MPTWPSPNETREMRLFSRLISAARSAQTGTDPGATMLDESLAQFIARRREPGDGWQSWDELRYELRTISGEFVSDTTIRKWAKRYGIPEATALAGGPVTSEQYAEAMTAAGITL